MRFEDVFHKFYCKTKLPKKLVLKIMPALFQPSLQKSWVFLRNWWKISEPSGGPWRAVLLSILNPLRRSARKPSPFTSNLLVGIPCHPPCTRFWSTGDKSSRNVLCPSASPTKRPARPTTKFFEASDYIIRGGPHGVTAFKISSIAWWISATRKSKNWLGANLQEARLTNHSRPKFWLFWRLLNLKSSSPPPVRKLDFQMMPTSIPIPTMAKDQASTTPVGPVKIRNKPRCLAFWPILDL